MIGPDLYGYRLFIEDGSLFVQCPNCHGVSVAFGVPSREYDGLRFGDLAFYVAGHRSVCAA